MKYFLHDTNSFNDDKITELYIKFGYEGLGLFYTILEKFANQEKPIKTIVLKKQLNIGKKLEKCWNFLEEIQLIQSDNGESFNERILNFAGKYKIKSEKNADRVAQWRDKQAVTKNVTHYTDVTLHDCNTDKVNKIKVKESKVIEEQEMTFISDDWEDIWKGWMEYKKVEHGNKFKSAKTEQTAINNLVELSSGDLETAKKVINQSISNNYKGLFKLKETKNGTSTKSNFDIYNEKRNEIHDYFSEIDRLRATRPGTL
jgi:hypothetical protein